MDLVSISENPAPKGAAVGYVETVDGRRLRYARWTSANERLGTVCLLQGRAEFIEKYYETIGELRTRGLDVVTWDWRGQGGSGRALDDPNKGYVQDFDEYQLDLEAMVEKVVLPHGRQPLIALAHSMGAAILLRYLASRGKIFARTIFVSPMIGLRGYRSSAVARTAFRIGRFCGFGTSYIPFGYGTAMDLRPFDGNFRTSDAERYSRNAKIVTAAPDLGLGSPTIGWTAAALDVMREIAKRKPAADLALPPSLFMASCQDEIASSAATKRFARSKARACYSGVKGARHELLMEKNEFREQFWLCFDEFVFGK